MIEIPYGRQFIDENDIQSVVDCLRGGILTQGGAISKFEKEIAEYVGCKYAVAVSSGTAALHLAMLASGIQAGVSAVTSPLTFIATSNAILYTGGSVIFSDIDPQTINLCPDRLSETLLNNSKENIGAIVPVHYAGLPCDMEKISFIANGIGASVIEDGAHALGAIGPDGSKVGSCKHSLMTIFSFHPVKSITMGEGGVITTNSKETYDRLLRLRTHGVTKISDFYDFTERSITNGLNNPWYYEMIELGYHYRITDFQCALGSSQLKKLDLFIDRRRELVRKYDEKLESFSNLKIAQTAGRDLSSHHLYPVRINFNALNKSRAEVMHKLKENGISTQVHYIPIVEHPYYKKNGHSLSSYPASESYYQETLSLPLYYSLTDLEQDKVIKCLGEILN